LLDEPAAWLVANVDCIPAGGTVLDVACGRGRNAVFLADRGWHVHAVDRDAALIAGLERHPRITTWQLDLEAGAISLGSRCYQAVVVFNYLHRPLMPAIVDAVAPGGVLIYETFTVDQASRGRPRNPAFLLNRGELATLMRPLRVVREREGEFDEKCVASVVAIR
jgi:2-polyprenyl-3-methyl-5-hydroxy-6-metoxy-1,4-benzoquinol methylase